MTTSSGLSPEAKEFVPLVQPASTTIPFYVDENTVASIYSSDQQPFMLQAIYPMMISNCKVSDMSANQLPEIEFHIQPSQQHQFHMDSCSSNLQASSTHANSSSTNTSQILLLPTPTSSTGAGTPTGYYPGPQMIYSGAEQASAFYPIEYGEQPLINFSLQHPTQLNKSNRISSQQQQLQRPSSFRQQHGPNQSSYRGNNRGNPNRNSYNEYNHRRNGASYPPNSGRGVPSTSKRISSSYQQPEYNHYYSPSSRSRGYGSQQQQQHHDDQRKEYSDYYQHERDFYGNEYEHSGQLNEDGTPFEFRPEDFPSLPINQPADKTPTQPVAPTDAKSSSSWNAIVSAPRPHSTSPHSVPSTSLPSQDQRSDRSRSINTKQSRNNDPKSSQNNHSNNNKKSPRQTTVAKSTSPTRASKIHFQEDKRLESVPVSDSPKADDDLQDDGFIQTKQQQRRLKRKNKNREEVATVSDDPASDSRVKASEVHITDASKTVNAPAHDDLEQRKSTRSKASINQDVDKNQKSSHKETDSKTAHVKEETQEYSTRLSSSSNNSSDTSDYDDAVDNLEEDDDD